MKKRVFLACLVGLLTATSAYSYSGECNGGTIITAKDGKTTFCQSNVQMNWWSAQAWCQINGSRLATIYEMCPSWDGNAGSNKCPELNKGLANQIVWSATASGSEYAFFVGLSNGTVSTYSRRNNNAYAFCR